MTRQDIKARQVLAALLEVHPARWSNIVTAVGKLKADVDWLEDRLKEDSYGR